MPISGPKSMVSLNAGFARLRKRFRSDDPADADVDLQEIVERDRVPPLELA